MANPAVIEITPEWEWVKVATNILSGTLHLITRRSCYYQTYRQTGVAAPTNPTGPSGNDSGIIPDEAIQMFVNCREESIEANENIDVYIFCANTDKDVNDPGKIRVDV